MDVLDPVVFLDRDGVLIKDVHYLSRAEDIKLYEDVPKGLSLLRKAGFKLIVVTNQSGVARGYFTEAFVLEAFSVINRQLRESGAWLDSQFYCPHHVDGNPPYNIACQCRKPKIGMIEQAAKQYQFDPRACHLIGDKLSDVEMAINANMNGVLLTTGHGQDEQGVVREKYPDTSVFSSFIEAAEYIISLNER